MKECLASNGTGATPDNTVITETMKNSCRKEILGTLKPKAYEKGSVSDISQKKCNDKDVHKEGDQQKELDQQTKKGENNSLFFYVLWKRIVIMMMDLPAKKHRI